MNDKYKLPPYISYSVYDKNEQKLEMRYALNETSKEFYMRACELVWESVQLALNKANA